MVAHRLVQVHAIQNRRIEAGKQLLGHDEDLRLLLRFSEALTDGLLPFLRERVLTQPVCVLLSIVLITTSEYSGGRCLSMASL